MPIKTYTVTISGREREDGEAPFTWVVNAESPWKAMCKAKDIHAESQEEAFDNMQIEEIFEGLPPEDCGYHWNDERGL
ncbi:hypothetical protein AB0G06_43575 [Nonomuraea dietziae]|uniref:hypothetical protein n=1 Tax=Nonomuraea dietziae TaxID=65515 RepID=UPI0033FDE917